MDDTQKIDFKVMHLDDAQAIALEHLKAARETKLSDKRKATVIQYYGSIVYYLDELKKLKDEHKN